jgi:hypothetical protein
VIRTPKGEPHDRDPPNFLSVEDISCPYQGHQKLQFELFLRPPSVTRVIVPQSLFPPKEPEAPALPRPGLLLGTMEKAS